MTRYVAPTEPGVTKSNDPLIFDPWVVLFRNRMTPRNTCTVTLGLGLGLATIPNDRGSIYFGGQNIS